MSQENTTEHPTAELTSAFQELFSSARPSQPAVGPEAEATPASTPVVASQEVAEQAQASSAAPAPASSELDQLRAELADRQKAFEDLQKRATDSINWARQGFLRKSNEAAQARSLLERAAQQGEIDKEDLERFLASGGSVVPQSSAPAAYPLAPPAQDDRAVLDASKFTIQYGLSEAEAQKFSAWIGSPSSTIVPEDDIVDGNHFQTLRNFYQRYQEASHTPDPLVAQAAATVARVQRETARAASAPSGHPRPTELPSAPDPLKMSIEERENSGLIQAALKELTRQYTSG